MAAFLLLTSGMWSISSARRSFTRHPSITFAFMTLNARVPTIIISIPWTHKKSLSSQSWSSMWSKRQSKPCSKPTSSQFSTRNWRHSALSLLESHRNKSMEVFRYSKRSSKFTCSSAKKVSTEANSYSCHVVTLTAIIFRENRRPKSSSFLTISKGGSTSRKHSQRISSTLKRQLSTGHPQRLSRIASPRLEEWKGCLRLLASSLKADTILALTTPRISLASRFTC